ncbi:hypothetical protein B0H12DRAFT_343713 [Mycena haematopus]|nr:hypothetical protein B0H12DRAFT_343713 [Mycena haematopus]
MQEGERFTWAIVHPSAVQTVAYANSELVTAAAQAIKCRQYLALVLERPPRTWDRSWLAFIVEPATLSPLPQTWLPIRPCTLGTREPLDPGFEWPFDDCVVNTSDVNPVTAIFIPDFIDTGKSPHVLSQSEADRFDEVFMKDREAVHAMQMLRRREERLAEGFSDGGTHAVWTTYSSKSIKIPPLPGEFFPRSVDLSAKVHYDLSATDDFGTLSDWQEERKAVLRLLARFSYPSTERAIRWAHQMQVIKSLQL